MAENKKINAYGKDGILAEGAGHGVDRDTPNETNPGEAYAGMERDEKYGPATGVSDPDAGPEPAEK